MLSFFSLIVMAQLSTWSLPGPQAPLHAMSGNCAQNLWIIRKSADSGQELWHTSGLSVHKVDIPASTDYFIPDPEENAFFTVQCGDISRWELVGSNFKPTPLGHLELVKNGLPVWRIGHCIDHTLFLPQKTGMTLFFTGKKNKSSLFFPYELIPLEKQDMTLVEAFPSVIGNRTSAWWQAGTILYQYQNQNIRSTPLAHSSSMGRVIPLLQPEETDWFIFDGNQGHLKTFGWRIIPGLQPQSGILTRLAQDPGRGRVSFTTVSNQVSSHLFASITGKKGFTSWVCEKAGPSWKQVYKKDFSLKDTPGLFGIDWPGDVNGDGLLDMTVSDKRGGFRVYLSVKGSGYAPKPRVLSRSVPEKLLGLDRGFAWIVSTGKGWNLFWQRSTM